MNDILLQKKRMVAPGKPLNEWNVSTKLTARECVVSRTSRSTQMGLLPVEYKYVLCAYPLEAATGA